SPFNVSDHHDHPSQSTPLPYTTLFRSHSLWLGEGGPRLLDDGRLGLDPRGSLYRGRRLLGGQLGEELGHARLQRDAELGDRRREDRKSTRLNSSHGSISYAVFCLKTRK